MSEKDYQLVMLEGPQPGQTFDLIGGTMTLGRDALADIIIVDPEVSRQHLQLTKTDMGYRLKDLGSTNGTFVNGRRLTAEEVDLESGQEIGLGSTIKLRYQEVGEAFVPPTIPADLEPEDEAVISFARPAADDDAIEATMLDLPPEMDEAEADEWPPPTYMAEDEELEERDIEAIFGETADSDQAPVTETAVPAAATPADMPASPLAPSVAPPAAPPTGEIKRNGPLVASSNGKRRGGGRKRVLLITTLLLLLCCCASLVFMYFIGGDLLLQYLELI